MNPLQFIKLRNKQLSRLTKKQLYILIGIGVFSGMEVSYWMSLYVPFIVGGLVGLGTYLSVIYGVGYDFIKHKFKSKTKMKNKNLNVKINLNKFHKR